MAPEQKELPENCWECDSMLNIFERQRGQCLRCFRDQDGPYEEDSEDEE